MAASPEPASLIQAKIDVLLREYDAVRREIISRTNNRFAIGGYAVAVAAFVGSQPQISPALRWCVALGALVSLCMLWCVIGHLIEVAASRAAEIESRVNAILGEEIMAYENRH